MHDPDGNYWVNTAVALASVIEHASVPVCAYLMHDHTLTLAARARLADIARRGRVPLHLLRVPARPEFAERPLRKFSVAANFRLLIPRVLRHLDLVIYLDSDLVANGLDIADLVRSVPGGRAVSAVHDPYMGSTPELQASLDRLSLPATEYFNSGVLALRPGLIPEDLPGEFVQFHRRHGATMHPDQDFLNVYFRGAIHALEERFNYQACLFDRRLLQPLASYGGKIVHYTGRTKPLEGFLATGFLPFWTHAARVPEAAEVFGRHPVRYVHPDAEHPHRVHFRRPALPERGA